MAARSTRFLPAPLPLRLSWSERASFAPHRTQAEQDSAARASDRCCLRPLCLQSPRLCTGTDMYPLMLQCRWPGGQSTPYCFKALVQGFKPQMCKSEPLTGLSPDSGCWSLRGYLDEFCQSTSLEMDPNYTVAQ